MAFTLSGFAAHLAGISIQLAAETHIMLEIAARIVEKEAKAEIGHYQTEATPFAEWEPLHYATLHGGVSPTGHRYPGKIELGYSPPDNPLLREGDLRRSIEHVVIGSTAHVGSDSMVAVWQELGTIYMSPRSFLGGAAVRKKKEIGKITGRRVAMILGGHANPVKTPIP